MRRLKLIFFAAAFAACATAFAQTLSQSEVNALVTRVDKTNFPSQYEMYITMRNMKPGGVVMENRLHAYHKDERMLIVILSPAIQRGQAILRSGDDMWMYLPNSRKTTRIGAKDKSMGGEASNTDLLRVDLARDYSGKHAGYETIDGAVCYKLELEALKRTVAYDRVVYWISRDREIPVKREYYALSGKKIKTMTFSDVRTFNGRVVPARSLIVNEENTDYRSEIRLEEVNEQVDLPDSMFTPAYLRQGDVR